DGIRDRTVTGVQTCALPIFFESVAGCSLDLATLSKTLGKAIVPGRLSRSELDQAPIHSLSGGSPVSKPSKVPCLQLERSDFAVRSEERRGGKGGSARGGGAW